MDPIKDNYKNWLSDELNDPEVLRAKEDFLRSRSEPVQAGSPKWLRSPAFRLALVSCFALAIMVKTGIFETTPPQTERATVAQEQKVIVNEAPQESVPVPIAPVHPERRVGINKLTSEVGPTVAYQKHFSDVDVTVLWVFPEGA